MSMQMSIQHTTSVYIDSLLSMVGTSLIACTSESLAMNDIQLSKLNPRTTRMIFPATIFEFKLGFNGLLCPMFVVTINPNTPCILRKFRFNRIENEPTEINMITQVASSRPQHRLTLRMMTYLGIVKSIASEDKAFDILFISLNEIH